jgi:hypothetical protein
MRKKIIIAVFFVVILLLVPFTTVTGSNVQLTNNKPLQTNENSNTEVTNIILFKEDEINRIDEGWEHFKEKYPVLYEKLFNLLDSLIITYDYENIVVKKVANPLTVNLESIIQKIEIFVDELLMQFGYDNDVFSSCQNIKDMLIEFNFPILCTITGIIILIEWIIIDIFLGILGKLGLLELDLVWTLVDFLFAIFDTIAIIWAICCLDLPPKPLIEIYDYFNLTQLYDSFLNCKSISIYDSSIFYSIESFKNEGKENNYQLFKEKPILEISQSSGIGNLWSINIDLSNNDGIDAICNNFDELLTELHTNNKIASTKMEFTYDFDFGDGKSEKITVDTQYYSTTHQYNSQKTYNINVDVKITLYIDINGDGDYDDEKEQVTFDNNVNGLKESKSINYFRTTGTFIQRIFTYFPMINNLLIFNLNKIGGLK